jgi:hypothetical protein
MIQQVMLTEIEREGILYQSDVYFDTQMTLMKWISLIILAILCIVMATFFIAYGIFSFFSIFSIKTFQSAILLLVSDILLILLIGLPAKYLFAATKQLYLGRTSLHGPGILYITKKGMHFIDKDSHESSYFGEFRIITSQSTSNYKSTIQVDTATGRVRIRGVDNLEEFSLLVEQQKTRIMIENMAKKSFKL